MNELKEIKGMEFTDQGWHVLTTDGEYHEFNEQPRPSYRANDHRHPQVDLTENMIVFGNEQAGEELKEMVAHAMKQAKEEQKKSGMVTIPGPTMTVVGSPTVRQIPIKCSDQTAEVKVRPDNTIRVWARPAEKATPVEVISCEG